MTMTLGTGDLLYQPVEDWEKLPEGWSFIEVPGVAVDSRDQVYLFNRGEHPVIVCDRDGNVLRTWGQGMFSDRTHGIRIGPDDSVYCVDDKMGTIQKFTSEGKLLMTIGEAFKPAPKWGGLPFNRPTQAAVSPVTGDLYISDGYANYRVHRYSPDGKHVLSWGAPGIDAGDFVTPHNLYVDSDDLVYVCDRDNHRIQIFDAHGKFVTMWNNIHRPTCICIDPEDHVIIGELNGFENVDDCPSLGHRVGVYDKGGNLLTRFGRPEEGEGPDQFIAPHGIDVDSRGDMYVCDVGYTVRGQYMDPPREVKTLRKFARVRR